MGNRLEINSGSQFGRLIILNEYKEKIISGKKERRFICLCNCGNIVIVQLNNLRSGNTSSCGCLNKESLSHIGNSKTIGNSKHNDSETIEYSTWCNMKRRCFDKKNNRYHRYGGRGITVCNRWLESYENFLEDMGRRPEGRYSIDRIDNDGNYDPSNCKWSTDKEQANNKKRGT